jgi:O-antigen/teichoic acid export membrane protein
LLKASLQTFDELRKTSFAKKFVILIADRGVQLLSQLFNIFVLAKFLGPAEFGVLLYGLSIYGLLLTLSNVGLDRVLIIELSQQSNPATRSELITSSLAIKIFFSVVILVGLYFGESFLLTMMSERVYQVLFLLSLSLLFSSWVVIDAYNQSNENFRFTAIARIVAALMMLLVRIGLVFWNVPFNVIIISFVVEQALCLLVAIIVSKGFLLSLVPVPFAKMFSIITKTLRSGLFVMFSTVCIVVYFRTSQGIVEQNFDAVFLGVYSLAIYIVEVPISLSSIMATIFTPQLTRSIATDKKESLAYAAKLLRVFILTSLFSVVAIILVGLIVAVFLKDEYDGFLPMLVKSGIALPIIFVGYFFNIYLLCSKVFSKYLFITFAGAAGALVFLFVARSYVTKETAVYLYVVSQLIASFIIPLIFHKPLRVVFSKAFTSFGKQNMLDLKPLYHNK